MLALKKKIKAIAWENVNMKRKKRKNKQNLVSYYFTWSSRF
jgi:hypothetical protein